MTLKEFRERINNSEHIEFYNNCIVEVNYPHLDYKSKLEGIIAVYGYIQKQNNNWSNKSAPKIINNSKEHFRVIKSQILSLVNDFHVEQALIRKWSQIKSSLESASTNNGTLVFTVDASESHFLIDLHEENPNYVTGAYNYIANINIVLNSIDLFVGMLRGYEFKLQGKSEITKRRNSEKSTIATIRNSFESFISDAENQINLIINSKQDEVKLQAENITNIVNNKSIEVDSWLEHSKQRVDEFDSNTRSNISELENTYQKKLQLEAPARYWSKKATKFQKDGELARNILFVFIGLVITLFSTILICAPDWIFTNVFKENTVAFVRWSIVFVAFLSLLAFAIRTIAKIMFSSFHLARDAEERHTLTFFYLALLKDSTVSEDDKKLIMQSLFSRVETGLLKDESGPTMPNDILSKVVNK